MNRVFFTGPSGFIFNKKMREKLKEYLTFTRKERLGVIILLIIVLTLFIVPYWIRRPPGAEDPEATRHYVPLIEKMESDSSRGKDYSEKFSGSGRAITERDGDYGRKKSSVPVRLFYFNPNEIGESDWQRLGLSERQSLTLVHYTGKGGRFRSAADLGKIYGLSVTDRARLMPYVRIPETVHFRENHDFTSRPDRISRAGGRDAGPEEKFRTRSTDREPYSSQKTWSKSNGNPSGFRNFLPKTPAIIDINHADSSGWERLPGIGEKLAARILRFREKLGGFYSIDQVAETFGLPDSTFQKIKPWLKSDSFPLQRIDLNTVTEETLRQHPYIRWKLATVLLRYREQHGKFESLDELGQIALVDPQTLDRLRPYLAVSK